MDDIMKDIRLKTKQHIIETATGVETDNTITEYEKDFNWKKHYQTQKHLTDDKIEQNVNFLISKIIGQEPDNPNTEFEDKLDFILDEYQDEDDEAMLQLLFDLEQSEINWGQLAEGKVSIFLNDELTEGKLFNKKSLTPSRIKSRKYYKQNRNRILKRKRILQNRISARAEKKKRDVKRKRMHRDRLNHTKGHVNEILTNPRIYINAQNEIVWSPDHMKYAIGEQIKDIDEKYTIIKTKRKSK